MAKYKRHKTMHPGVYYIIGTHAGTGKPEKIFYIRYPRGGKEIEEKVGRQFQDKMTEVKANKRRALRMDGDQKTNSERREEERAAIEAEKGRWTISRLWAEYQAQKTGYKGAAFDGNRFGLYLESDFGPKAPEEIITLDVDRLRVRLMKKMAPQSVKNTLELLRRIINFGVKRGLCPRPMHLHFAMPKTDNAVTEDLSSDQLEALLKTIGEESNRQAANLMLLALYTGMRKGELFRLQWRDVNFDTGFIHIREPKGGKSQKIPLNEAARAMLEGHERTGSDFVFPGPSGKMRKDCRVVSCIRDRAGLPKSFRPLHGLRHVYASMLASSGEVDMYTLQKLMTHKSPQMTQRYAHLRDEALQRASQVAGDIFSNLGKDKGKVVNLDDHRGE